MRDVISHQNKAAHQAKSSTVSPQTTQRHQEKQQQTRSLFQNLGIHPQTRVGAADSPEEKQAHQEARASSSSIPLQSSLPQGTSRKLNAHEQHYFGQRFQQNVNQIQLHHTAQTHQAAKVLGARAFSLGNNIYFGKNEFQSNQGAQQLLTHEVTHAIQHHDRILRRWGAAEHRAFGNMAGNLVVQNFASELSGLGLISTTNRVEAQREVQIRGKKGKGKYQNTLQYNHQEVFEDHEGNEYEVERTDNFGTATELSGDQRASAADLGRSSYGNHDLPFVNYALLAHSNRNHFFPLASKQWEVSHAQAIGYAQTAAAAKDPTVKKLATQRAIQTEAFGQHFLQDSFASGHQYPKALDKLADDEFMRGFRSKTYHDIFCALPNGIDILYARGTQGGSQKFHGDGTANQIDYPVAEESFNSLSEVMVTLLGKDKSQVTQYHAKPPKAAQGPNVREILKDPEAGPVWIAMEKDLDNVSAIHNRFSGNQKDTLDSGDQLLSPSEIQAEWDRVHTYKTAYGYNKRIQAKDLMETDESKVVSAMTKDPGINQHNIDDNLMEYLGKHKKFPDFMSAGLIAVQVQNLIEGACFDDEEKAILIALSYLDSKKFFQVLDNISLSKLDSGIDWGRWTNLLQIIAHHFTGSDKYYQITDNTKLMKTLIRASTLSSDDKLKKYGIENNFIVSYIASENDDDLSRYLVNTLHRHNAMNKVNPYQWISVIKALLSGSCGDDDEDAIVLIVRHLKSINQHQLVNTYIGKETMDSGVDDNLFGPYQWTTIKNLMGWK